LNIEDGDTELTVGSDVFMNATPTTVYLGRDISSVIFDENTKLTTITVGEKVTSITGNAFNNCSAINTVTSNNSVPPIIDNDTFSNDTYLNGTLNIPSASIDAYTDATGWKNFISITPITPIDTAVTNVYSDANIHIEDGAICINDNVPASIVTLNGVTVYRGQGVAKVNVTPGIYIVNIGGKTTKIVVN
jgi:hypothetical protein